MARRQSSDEHARIEIVLGQVRSELRMLVDRQAPLLQRLGHDFSRFERRLARLEQRLDALELHTGHKSFKELFEEDRSEN